MKTLSCLFVVLALAGLVVADDFSGKPPQDPNQPKVQKPLPDPNQPKVQKPLPDPNQPKVQKPLPDPNQPKVQKPLLEPEQPKVKKPQPNSNHPKVKKPGHAAWEDEFNQLSQRCDENKDGVVTLEEFQAHQPQGKDPASVEKWFRVHDRDGDGALSKADFRPQPKVK